MERRLPAGPKRQQPSGGGGGRDGEMRREPTGSGVPHDMGTDATWREFHAAQNEEVCRRGSRARGGAGAWGTSCGFARLLKLHCIVTSLASTTTSSQSQPPAPPAAAAGVTIEAKSAPSRTEVVDLVVIGGGIVGLATAWAYLQRHPGRSVVVLEKEAGVGRHQSGHNSGVVHSGIYYKQGSAKAVLCRRGKGMLEQFCREHGVPLETCGKVIVATRERELPMLNRLYERGLASSVQCEMIGPGRLKEIEPHAAGLAAIHVRETGITDYGAVCAALARCVMEAGGRIVTESAVLGAADRRDMVTLETERMGAGGVGATWRTTAAVNCAGLHSDRIARLAGMHADVQIVPFRGEYYRLTEKASELCRNLIYPVPDPGFPFLGVHFTRMIAGGVRSTGEGQGDGVVECGPNAVLALAREGYRWRDVDRTDLWETIRTRAFWAMTERHWPTGLWELARSASKAAFVLSLRRLVPEIRGEHLVRAGSGVRAQAVGRDGNLLDDFEIRRTGRMVHVLNAPSPGATGALAIGEMVMNC